MDYNLLSADVSVAPQITANDVPAVQAAGFRSIVGHRPDGEALGQPDHDEVEQAACKVGIAFRYQPIQSGKVLAADGEAFAAMIRELPTPILAYCRSGARSSAVFALAKTFVAPSTATSSSAPDAER